MDEVSKKILKRNEAEANLIAGEILLGVSVLSIFFTFILPFFLLAGPEINEFSLPYSIADNLIRILIFIVIRYKKGQGKFIKWGVVVYFMIFPLFLSILYMRMLWLLYAIPVLVISRYYSVKSVIFTGIATCISMIASVIVYAKVSIMMGNIDPFYVEILKETDVHLNVEYYSLSNGLSRIYDSVDFPGTYKVIIFETMIQIILMVLVTFIMANISIHGRRIIDVEIAAVAAEAKAQSMDEIERSLKEAEDANKAKTDFLFNMSHDIRTPMNAILGFVDIAEKNMDNPERVEDCLVKMKHSSVQLLNLINDVLELSRIEAGQTEIKMEANDVRMTTSGLLDVFEPLLKKKNILFENDIRIEEHYFAKIDSHHINQIVFNIVSNAIKYSKENGKVCCLLEEIPSEKENETVYKWTVSDDGMGMSEEFVKHAFERFSREQNTTTSGIEGTGLGLAMVNDLVNLMNGQISINSEKGVGTTISFEIPCELCDEKEIPKHKRIGNTVDFKGKKILVVEDNELNREILKDYLERYEIIVDEAVNGQDCIAKIKEKGPNYYFVILMDIQMPVMNGYEATNEIRKAYPNSKIPIIAVSANAFEEDRRKSREKGMDNHIAKPINMDELMEVLEMMNEEMNN